MELLKDPNVQNALRVREYMANKQIKIRTKINIKRNDVKNIRNRPEIKPGKNGAQILSGFQYQRV